MDIDICGPSIPKMLGLEGEEIHQSNLGWSPVYVQVGTRPRVALVTGIRAQFQAAAASAAAANRAARLACFSSSSAWLQL
jgi:hypothetical protein